MCNKSTKQGRRWHESAYGVLKSACGGRDCWVWIEIRIQHFRLTFDPDPDPILFQVFNNQKIGKNLQLKKNYIFGSKTTINISLGLFKGCPNYRRSLQLSKENIQHLKRRRRHFLIFFYFCRSLLASWIRIRIPNNTDPDSE